MENLGITYQQAEELVNKYITNPITKLHLRETEVFMRALANRFNEDEEKWGIIGLLHDIDWDLTKDNPKEHCIKAQDILIQEGVDNFIIETIISHCYGNNVVVEFKQKSRSTVIQHCLAAAETLTGLIIASALIIPDKKLNRLSLESLKKKFKNKKFAENCDRNIILECEKVGISIDEFLKIGLESLQGISSELGL